MRFRVVFAWLFLVAGAQLMAVVPCASGSTQEAQQDERLLKLVPDPLPAQAVPKGTPAFFTADNLYEYMNGASDAFILYDFQKLLHGEFGVGEGTLDLDIFDMGTPENAFGIYAAERSPDLKFMAIGAEGYQHESALNFVQGRYYVKLSAFGKDTAPLLPQLARSVSAKIGEAGGLPALLQQLPRTHLKPHTEQYILKNPLGHEFLGPAYRATYSLNNQESTLLVSVAASPTEARQRLELLARHFRSSGSCKPAPELGDGAIQASNSFEGKLIATASCRYLIMLVNPAPGSEAILKEAVDRLK